ncbi:hypothetical protein FRC96_08480 [Lujinxingia vulgaris]|uniref:Uncharacterized protein n=1 Tax=Lujinxingia vulgaris TaxID=2600176 RepID=A0A5C6XGX7_9DELT|nr:hypothetical protein [Lujinxingia vulgaris]TXD37368.1 hypothetical protein FRC96_08480 [Lujinxingia vulgaris]
MAGYLNEMENEGLIVIGRPVRSEFESADAIKKAAAFVAELGAKHGVPLSFVYAGTTINWPDDFDFTPSLIGIVTHVDYGSDEMDGNEPLPRQALEPREIPDAIWEAPGEYGLEVEDETSTYLAVAGWTWTEIKGADGERIKGVSAEDYGYTRIDGITRIMEGDEALTMRTSYC